MCEVLVEDEPNLRMLAAELLADTGYHVVEFEMAADAKAFAEVPNWLTTLLADVNMLGSRTASTSQIMSEQYVRRRPPS